MIQAELKELYTRDIHKIIKEIEQYPTDADVWNVTNGISNSGGNLCLHLTGSLNHFIGATLGGTGYVRNREAEFADKNKTKAELILGLQQVSEVVAKTFSALSDTDLTQEFPFDFAGKQSTRFYLMLFLGHLNYHLGQINYHRRLLA